LSKILSVRPEQNHRNVFHCKTINLGTVEEIEIHLFSVCMYIRGHNYEYFLINKFTNDVDKN